MKTSAVVVVLAMLLSFGWTPARAEQGQPVTLASSSATAPVPDFTNPQWKTLWIYGLDPTATLRMDALGMGLFSKELKESALLYANLDYFSRPGGAAGVLAIVHEERLDRYANGLPVAYTYLFYARGETGNWKLIQRAEIQLGTEGIRTPLFDVDSPFGQLFVKWAESFGTNYWAALGLVPSVYWQRTNSEPQPYWSLPEAARMDDPHWQL